MKALFIFVLLCFSTQAWCDVAILQNSLQRARDLHLSEDPQWLRLLHVKPNLWGHPESQIDGPAFFLAADGKYNSLAELEATLKGLYQADFTSSEEEAVACRFPARAFFLRTHLAEAATWPDRRCPHFQSWFQTLRGTSISLVFSSYYLNNPSSQFGHTFLRVNKAPNAKTGERFELLDYGLNFAANANTTNPFIYTYNGLFGGFPGVFTTQPYYYKVREYNNAEARDLWQYELSIPTSGVDLIVAHFWELGPTSADYWYLTENCSYFVLTLLEVGDPNLNLTDRLKKYVIPTDTVQVVWNTPGLVKSLTFRPSTRTELFARLRELSEEEKNWVATTVATRKLQPGLSSWTSVRQQKTLDAAIDHMDYRYSVAIQKRGTPEEQFKNQLLGLRSQIPEITERLKIEPPVREAPQSGHGSRAVSFGVSDSDSQGGSALFHYRFAFHDFLDPRVGYPEYAQIIFFDFGFAYFEKTRHLEMNRLTLFEVASLTPYSQFSNSLSWNLHVGTEALRHPDCLNCQAGVVTGGAGYSIQLADDPLWVGYLGLKGGVFYTTSGGASDNGERADFPRWLLGVGPHLILKSRWNDRWVALLEGWYRKETFLQSNELKELSLSTEWTPSASWGLRLTGVERWFEHSVSLQSYFYF